MDLTTTPGPVNISSSPNQEASELGAPAFLPPDSVVRQEWKQILPEAKLLIIDLNHQLDIERVKTEMHSRKFTEVTEKMKNLKGEHSKCEDAIAGLKEALKQTELNLAQATKMDGEAVRKSEEAEKIVGKMEAFLQDVKRTVPGLPEPEEGKITAAYLELCLGQVGRQLKDGMRAKECFERNNDLFRGTWEGLKKEWSWEWKEEPAPVDPNLDARMDDGEINDDPDSTSSRSAASSISSSSGAKLAGKNDNGDVAPSEHKGSMGTETEFPATDPPDGDRANIMDFQDGGSENGSQVQMPEGTEAATGTFHADEEEERAPAEAEEGDSELVGDESTDPGITGDSGANRLLILQSGRVVKAPNYYVDDGEESSSEPRTKRQRTSTKKTTVASTSQADASSQFRKPLECPSRKCKLRYETLPGLKKHGKNIHPNEGINWSTLRACLRCGILFESDVALRTHKKRHRANDEEAVNSNATNMDAIRDETCVDQATQQPEGSPGDLGGGASDEIPDPE